MDKLGLFVTGFISLGVGSLGVWQFQRSKWKEDLIIQRQNKLSQKKVDLLDFFDSLVDEDINFTPITSYGEYDYSNECYVGPKSAPELVKDKTSSGYDVYTPFILAKDSSKILVNRGWAPKSMIENNISSIQPDINILNGIIRDGEAPRFGVDVNKSKITGYTSRKPHRPYLYVADLQTIANSSNITVVQNTKPLLVESTDQTGGKYPVTKTINSYIDFHITPMIHKTYSISWFTLAIAIGYIGFRRFGTTNKFSQIIKKK